MGNSEVFRQVCFDRFMRIIFDFVVQFCLAIKQTLLLRGCLHEPYKKGWPYSARSRVLFEILIKNCLRLHEKRASPPRRDLAIAYPRSRLVGLEISHINATEGASPPSRAE